MYILMWVNAFFIDKKLLKIAHGATLNVLQLPQFVAFSKDDGKLLALLSIRWNIIFFIIGLLQN